MTKEDAINAAIQEWAEIFINDIRNKARNLPKATGAGQDSFDVNLIKATSATAAVVITDFAAYLRLFDMRMKKRNTDLDPLGIDALKKWITTKGVSGFLSGYKYPLQVRKSGRLVDVPVTRIINNIAWGISKKKRPLKRNKWYNKTKGTSIYQLYGKLVDVVVEYSLKDVKEGIVGNELF